MSAGGQQMSYYIVQTQAVWQTKPVKTLWFEGHPRNRTSGLKKPTDCPRRRHCRAERMCSEKPAWLLSTGTWGGDGEKGGGSCLSCQGKDSRGSSTLGSSNTCHLHTQIFCGGGLSDPSSSSSIFSSCQFNCYSNDSKLILQFQLSDPSEVRTTNLVFHFNLLLNKIKSAVPQFSLLLEERIMIPLQLLPLI